MCYEKKQSNYIYSLIWVKVCQCLIDYLQMVIIGFIGFSLASTITPFYVMEILQLTYHLMEGIYAAESGTSLKDS